VGQAGEIDPCDQLIEIDQPPPAALAVQKALAMITRMILEDVADFFGQASGQCPVRGFDDDEFPWCLFRVRFDVQDLRQIDDGKHSAAVVRESQNAAGKAIEQQDFPGRYDSADHGSGRSQVLASSPKGQVLAVARFHSVLIGKVSRDFTAT